MPASRPAPGGGAGPVQQPPAARLLTLGAGLEELGCEALLVVAPVAAAGDPDLAPFLQTSAHLSAALLIAPRSGDTPSLAYLSPMERDEALATGLRLITPQELEVLRAAAEAPTPAAQLAWVAERALAAAGVPPGRVALAGHAPAGELVAACAALSRQGWQWVPGNDLVRRMRKSKSAAEVAAIRRAAAAACAAIGEVAGMLAAAAERGGELWLGGERLVVGRLRAAIAGVMEARGVEQPHGNIVAPGDEGGVPHSAGTDSRALRAGEPLVVDVYPRAAGRADLPLYADCTRTLCAGVPPPEVVRAHAAVAAALAAARRSAVAGVRGWDLQVATCQQFAAAGYATPLQSAGTQSGYVHNLGHGVGYELHELPVFRQVAGSEGLLAAGDVFTLEPGLYDPAGGYGVRLEDLFHLGADGSAAELLTPLPYDLDPRCYATIG